MDFSYIVDGILVVKRAVIPASARRLSDGAWVMGLDTASVAARESCGYFEITSTPQPPDTVGQIWELDIELIEGRPTVTWTQRPETIEEFNHRVAAANRELLMTQVGDNIATLLTSVTALNEITSRTNATINANPAVAIKDLTRELKTVTRQAIRISRAFARVLDSADSGS